MIAGLRSQLHRQLDPAAWSGKGLSPLNRAVAALIVLSVVIAVLGSEPTLVTGHEALWDGVELGIGILFAVEYLTRLWVCVEAPAIGPGLRGRLRYLVSPAALLDLVALSPLLIGAIGAEAYLARLVRLVRVARLARLGRFSSAMRLLGEALSERRFELAMSAVIALLILLLSSTLLYLIEGAGQPEAFGSIPRAMWWSMATLTTVGYGDVFPLTPLGRVLAGITAFTGIGLIAMPTGILAAAFSDALQRRRTANDEQLEDGKGRH